MNQIISITPCEFKVVVDFEGKRYEETFERYYEAKALVEQIKLLQEK